MIFFVSSWWKIADQRQRSQTTRQDPHVSAPPRASADDCRLALSAATPTVHESLTTTDYSHTTEGTKMTLIDADPYSQRVIGCAIEAHRTLGPGLIESIYEACLCHELTQAGLAFVRQQKLPVVYKEHRLECDLTMDVVVEQTLVLEIKSVRVLHPVHEAQLLTYLKRSGFRSDLLLNLNEIRLIDGVRRRLL
jgi:GxxExxY protein